MPSVTIRRKVDRLKGRDGGKAHYSPKQRLEAVTAYLMLGKVSLVAGATGIPEETLFRWKATDWWKEMVKDIRSQSNVQLSGRLAQIVNRSMDVIEDRLQHGDYQFNPKTSTFVRRPVGAKVAGDIMSKSLDKQLLIDKLEQEPAADSSKIEDRLKAIQQKLLEVSRFQEAKTIEGEATNVQDSVGSDQGVLCESDGPSEESSGIEGSRGDGQD